MDPDYIILFLICSWCQPSKHYTNKKLFYTIYSLRQITFFRSTTSRQPTNDIRDNSSSSHIEDCFQDLGNPRNMPLPMFRILPPTPVETSPLSDRSPSPPPPIPMRSLSRRTALTLSLSLDQTSHQADNDTSHSSLTPPVTQPLTHISAEPLPQIRFPSAFGTPLERCPRNASSSGLTRLPVLKRTPALQQVSSSTEPAEESKRGRFKQFVKRLARFLFHSDGGRTDSHGDIIFDPYGHMSRGPNRAGVSENERPIFREIDWNPPPRLGRKGAMRKSGGRCKGEECCGGRGRDTRARPQLVGDGTGYEWGEEAIDTSEMQGWGREVVETMRHHADSAVSGLGDKPKLGEGQQCQCQGVEDDDQGDEESWNGELSPHPSPKTRLEDCGGYF